MRPYAPLALAAALALPSTLVAQPRAQRVSLSFTEAVRPVAVDPGGAVFGLWEHGSFTGAGIEGEHGAMCWTEVACRNAAANAEFYAAVFDLRSERLANEAVEYYTLHDGEPAVAGVLQMDAAWEGIPPHWMPYFAVDSLGVANATLTKHGGNTLHGPIPSPHGKIMVVQDAQGAVFSYMSEND